MSIVRLFVLLFLSLTFCGPSEAQIAPSPERSIVSNMVSTQIAQSELLRAQTDAINALKKRVDALEARVGKVGQTSGKPKAAKKKSRKTN